MGRVRGDPVFDTRYLAPQNFSQETKKTAWTRSIYMNPFSFWRLVVSILV